jgi:sigma-54 interacting transcriptional regulator/GAF domain-containing protein
MANGLLALDEPERLAALRHYAILDTPPEPAFDQITALAAWFFRAPIAAISLVDDDHVWFKSRYGLAPDQIGREIGLWAAAILAEDVYCIANAAEDPHTSGSPLVTGELGLRFYAAAPLRTRDGHSLGALCVIDRRPHEITEAEKEFLRRLAAVVMELIELRLAPPARAEFLSGKTDRGENRWAAAKLNGWTAGSAGEWADEWRDGWDEPKELIRPEPPARFQIRFNQSLLGKSEQRQLDWLNERIVGDSVAMRATLNLVRLAITGQADSILVMGETGTGKGLCALAIHEGSGSRGRFVEVNCGALPRELIESELFGHEKGSFTGATARRIGLFEQADGGTIFLDEITELPPDLQVRLLSVLQGRELRRVGGTTAIPINVRVIAATNRKLVEAIKDGSLRRDLFFRLGLWRIESEKPPDPRHGAGGCPVTQAIRLAWKRSPVDEYHPARRYSRKRHPAFRRKYARRSGGREGTLRPGRRRRQS